MKSFLFNKRNIVFILGLTCFSLGFVSLNAQQTTTRYYTAYTTDSTAIAIDSTSGGVGFTSSKLTPTNQAYRAELVTFTVECAGGATSCPFRFTLDGTAPTTSIGNLLDYGAQVAIYNYFNLAHFKAIRTGSTSASLQPIYYY